jgi:hypothetical protein
MYFTTPLPLATKNYDILTIFIFCLSALLSVWQAAAVLMAMTTTTKTKTKNNKSGNGNADEKDEDCSEFHYLQSIGRENEYLTYVDTEMVAELKQLELDAKSKLETLVKRAKNAWNTVEQCDKLLESLKKEQETTTASAAAGSSSKAAALLIEQKIRDTIVTLSTALTEAAECDDALQRWSHDLAHTSRVELTNVFGTALQRDIAVTTQQLQLKALASYQINEHVQRVVALQNESSSSWSLLDNPAGEDHTDDTLDTSSSSSDSKEDHVYESFFAGNSQATTTTTRKGLDDDAPTVDTSMSSASSSSSSAASSPDQLRQHNDTTVTVKMTTDDSIDVDIDDLLTKYHNKNNNKNNKKVVADDDDDDLDNGYVSV